MYHCLANLYDSQAWFKHSLQQSGRHAEESSIMNISSCYLHNADMCNKSSDPDEHICFYICPLSLQSDLLLTHLWLASQDAGTIQVLPVYLQRGYSTDVQLEALHAMYNMCKISPTRQEAAALAGVVPLLVKLAVSPPSESGEAPSTAPQSPAQMSGSDAATSNGEEVASVSGRGPYPLRPLAVSLLCGMAHSTHRTRHELWAHNVVALLLDLLKEEVILSNSPSSSRVQFGPNTKWYLQTGFTFVVVMGSYAVEHYYRLHYRLTSFLNVSFILPNPKAVVPAFSSPFPLPCCFPLLRSYRSGGLHLFQHVYSMCLYILSV